MALTTKIAAYIVGHKIRGTKKFATVLQLEPLHTCNLTCTGCGRIREYSTSIKDMMSLEDCLGAAQECNAPMVSICGGEPLIYPHIEALINGLLEQRRQARVVADFAEYLAEDVHGDPERVIQAREALAILRNCILRDRDLELLVHVSTEVHRRDGLPAAMRKNRYAAQLLDLVDRAS